MNNHTKYWIAVDSWNLMESFVTESISPYSFYMRRGFGNNLSRFFSKGGETFDHLILTEFLPTSKYSIEVSSVLLDEILLEKSARNVKGVFLYPKTIYFRKGYVRFRFDNDELRTSFIAESKILFEVKCIEKYQDDFFSNESAVKSLRKMPTTRFSFDQDKYLLFDTKFNLLKGAVIGYSRGQMTSLNDAQQNLQIYVNDLKNSFAGLYTRLMMNDDPIYDMACLAKIAQCKKSYHNQQLEQTNLFDIFSQVFKEIVKLAELRSNELKRQKTPDYKKDIEYSQNKKEELQSLMYDIETYYSIDKIRKELDAIKHQEVLNGKALGKSRLYFGKTTPEYQRKLELKETIQKFENENKEYWHLKKELTEIESKIANHRYGSTDFDNTISSLFIRLSDGINEILKKISLTNISGAVDLSKIKIENLDIEVSDGKSDVAELEYFNLVLNHILRIPLPKSRIVSDVDILEIVQETGKQFAQSSYSKTETGKSIIDSLRNYWNYKQNKAANFDIPENLRIFQSIMSFFIKAQGFDQIERFMLHRKFTHKEYAFMLWGAYIGFASMPKTFTNVIYNNELIDRFLEGFFEIIKCNS